MDGDLHVRSEVSMFGGEVGTLWRRGKACGTSGNSSSGHRPQTTSYEHVVKQISSAQDEDLPPQTRSINTEHTKTITNSHRGTGMFITVS